uniref:Uncharacterized protein n=1 Tax=Oryza sativa subsp. japonica TaxID=39947 RepID=Q67VE0_ORYSJ|nr:hypothetical protein [Oryza sativa Japonica Group]
MAMPNDIPRDKGNQTLKILYPLPIPHAAAPQRSPLPPPPPPPPGLASWPKAAASCLSSSPSPAAGCHHRPSPPTTLSALPPPPTPAYRPLPTPRLRRRHYRLAAHPIRRAAASHGHPSKAGELPPLPPPLPPTTPTLPRDPNSSALYRSLGSLAPEKKRWLPELEKKSTNREAHSMIQNLQDLRNRCGGTNTEERRPLDVVGGSFEQSYPFSMRRRQARRRWQPGAAGDADDSAEADVRRAAQGSGLMGSRRRRLGQSVMSTIVLMLTGRSAEQEESAAAAAR